MSRPILLAFLCLAAVASPASAGFADAPLPDGVVTPKPGDCVALTLVTSEAEKARADVYVDSSRPFQQPPDDPSLDDFATYVQEVRAEVVRTLQEEPSLDDVHGNLQVELTFPRDEDAGHDGYRVTLLANVTACLI